MMYHKVNSQSYFVLNWNSKIKDAIINLNKSQKRIVIIEKNNKFYGVINDGDIRRGLIKGFSINDDLEKIVNKKPKILKSKQSTDQVARYMNKHNIYQIPVVDNFKKVKGLYIYDFEQNKLNNNVFVIMAGGLGKRMLPLTKLTPKPMLKFKGKPILEHIILKAKKEGFRNFIISVYYKKEIIKNYFKNGSKLGINIEYIEESKPQGTAGSLSKLKNYSEQDFVITNSDVITDISYKDLLQYHKKKRSNFTIVTKLYESQIPFGVVKIKNNKLKSILEKPVNLEHINAGIYCINSNIFQDIKFRNKLDMNELLDQIKISNDILVYPIHEYWRDIGNLSAYKEINSK